ncbi:hypothetical protein OG535_22460 [Kitasatospora sp. NBC_00085]|uniref:caspase, EACC1-associated type n=1 Tax=Kitasatospora sp. NBC_00085 TaxID=2903566 RepID=UPI00324720F4
MAPPAPRRSEGFAVPGARAVVVGTARHAAAVVPDGAAALPRLPDLPSAATTARDIAAVLHEVCGMAPDQITLLVDPPNDGVVVAAVEEAVAEARGPVLFYFVGHGLLSAGDELYVATSASTGAGRVAYAVPFQSVRDPLSGCLQPTAVILDCCFSGLADVGGGLRRDPFVSARPRGSFLLTSASGFDRSYAPEGERHTRFSGELLRLLGEGHPGAPAWLTLEDVYARLDQQFANTDVRPHRQSSDRAGELVLARNLGYPLPPQPDRDQEPVRNDGAICPYPGMEAFRPEEYDYFFGREELVGQLLAEVLRPAGQAPPVDGAAEGRAVVDGAAEESPGLPVMLVGASGAGKSSILRAGLLPALERRYGADPAVPWPALLLEAPGPRPLRALAARWAQALDRPVADVEEELAAGAVPAGCPVLLVDQFEEVFSRCPDEQERGRFVAALCEAAAAGVRVVIALRADRYDSCLDHPQLVRALHRRQVIVPQMGEDGLRAAIEGPAAQTGLALEPGLTDLLLRDAGRGGGPALGSALPFLAHALRQTWVRRSDRTLTLAGYAATGGIWDSLTHTAEAIHDELDEEGRALLRDLMLSMIQLPDGREGAVRRQVRLRVLREGRSREQRELLALLLDRLAAARLVTVGRGSAQLAHEALLRAWPRLKGWIEADRADLVKRQQLASAVDAWDRSGRDPAYLYVGTRLAAAAEWATDERAARLLRTVDERFLRVSQAAEQAVQARELRRLRVLRRLLAVTAAALCLALAAAYLARQQQLTAQEQRQAATARVLVSDARDLRDVQPENAIAMGLAAVRLDSAPHTRAGLATTLAQSRFLGARVESPADPVDFVDESAFSHDSRLLVGVTRTAVVLWDVADPLHRRRLAELPVDRERVTGFGFSPDDRTLVVLETGRDPARVRTVTLWGLADPARPVRSAVLDPGLTEGADSVSFSGDGTMMAVVGSVKDTECGTLTLWDLHDRTKPVRVTRMSDLYDCDTVSLSPDGRTLVIGDGMIKFSSDVPDPDSVVKHSGMTVWDISDPTRPRRLKRIDGWSAGLVFSADGRLLVTRSGIRVRLWDMADPADPRALSTVADHTDDVSALRFSPDGRRLASGDGVGTVVESDVTDPAHPRVVATVTNRERDIEALAYSPDGRTLTTLDGQNRLTAWDVGKHTEPTLLGRADLGASGHGIAFTPDGRFAAVGTAAETVELWDLSDPQHPRAAAALTGHTRMVDTVAFSPDGTVLASGAVDETILWDVTDRASPRLAVTLPGTRGNASVGFTPDGTTLITSGAANSFASGTSVVWDVRDRGRPVAAYRLEGASATAPVRISPDGRLLLVPLDTGGNFTKPMSAVFRRTPDGGWKAVQDDGHPYGVGQGAFSPDSRTLAVTKGGAGVVLWNLADPDRPREAAQLADIRDSHAVAYHPGGKLVAGASSAGAIAVWDVEAPDQAFLLARLSMSTGGEVGFSPDGRLLVGVSDRTLQVWELGDLPAVAADLIGLACHRLSGQLPDELWKKHAPGVSQPKLC